MESIQQILNKEKERDHENYIYIYKQGNCWFAYELSAFYLFSMCCVDAVVKIVNPEDEDRMLVTVILKNGLKKGNNPHLKILQQTDHSMIMDCTVRCNGFEYWKDRLPLFTNLNYIRGIEEYYSSLR